MRMQHGLVLLSVLILGACTTPADIPPARMHAPSVWSAAVPVVVDADPTPAWWMVLGDDTLNVWIEHAMRDSADLQVLLARLEQAQAWADAKAAARAPSFGVQVSVAHERTSQMDLHHPDGSRTDTPPAWQRRLGGGLEGRYEIDLLGRLSRAQRAAEHQTLASAEDLRALRCWLTSEIVQTYVELRRLEADIAAQYVAVGLLQTLVEIEQRRLAGGIGTRESLRQAQRAQDAGQDRRAELSQHHHAAFAQLALLLGRAPGALLVPENSQWWERLADFTGALPPDMPATVMGRRADVAAAWQRVLAASQSAQQVARERYPTLILTGNAGYASPGLDQWLGANALAWATQVALSIPLFDGGQRRAQTQVAQAGADEAYAQYRQTVLRALVEADVGLHATASAQGRVVLARKELQRHQASASAIDQAWQSGTVAGTAVLEVQGMQLQAAALLRQRQYEWLAAWTQAQRAFGR